MGGTAAGPPQQHCCPARVQQQVERNRALLLLAIPCCFLLGGFRLPAACAVAGVVVLAVLHVNLCFIDRCALCCKKCLRFAMFAICLVPFRCYRAGCLLCHCCVHKACVVLASWVPAMCCIEPPSNARFLVPCHAASGQLLSGRGCMCLAIFELLLGLRFLAVWMQGWHGFAGVVPQVWSVC
jgi:hypothetical protein